MWHCLIIILAQHQFRVNVARTKMRNELLYMKVLGLHCSIKVFSCFLYKLGSDENKMYTYCSARNLTLTLKNSKINFYFNNFYNISTCISNLNILHSIISWYWNILKVYLFWRCLRRSLNLINKLDTNFNESIQIFLYIEYKKFDCLFIEQPQCWTEHDA